MTPPRQDPPRRARGGARRALSALLAVMLGCLLAEGGSAYVHVLQPNQYVPGTRHLDEHGKRLLARLVAEEALDAFGRR